MCRGDDRKQLVVWALGHGNTGIKQYVKSSKAKEVLAGLKLCELLMAQVHSPACFQAHPSACLCLPVG